MTKLKRMRPLLGTFVEIGIITKQNNGSDAISSAFKQIEMIQKLLSFHDPNSDLTKLNKFGSKGVELNPISADVLRLALHMTGITQGEFNCTVGGSLIKKGILPNHSGVPPLTVGTADDVTLNGCIATLLRPVSITLDGIAKGYAVDQAINTLQAHGINSGWVNAGGDLRVFGELEVPVYRRELDESLSFLGHFSNTAISTSSINTNHNPRFPSMIIDSKNISRKIGVWTVKANMSWLADALTKVAGVVTEHAITNRVSSLGGELIYSKPL
ncbi:MAG: FAD:protein FMN transferase [Piscirickettsiaceae bacterium]|nr:FAD:protein FMN transferase [Piscirickettsiaceae bacterium]